MSLKEYESWKQYLEAMKGKVNNGEIPPEDLTAFVNYSRTMDITRSNPVSEVPKREPERSQGRVVKPFVPERISRSDLERKPEEPAAPSRWRSRDRSPAARDFSPRQALKGSARGSRRCRI